MTPAPLLLTAAAGAAAGIFVARHAPRLWLAMTLASAASALAAAVLVLSGADWEWRGPFSLGGETLHVRLDGLSAIFLALLSVVGGAGAAYARDYWNDRDYPSSAPAGRMWWSGIVLSLGLVLVMSNGLHFLIAWELFAVCAYFLITLDRQRHRVRAAGWLYLASSHVATLCLFGFFAALAAFNGNWDLGSMRDRPEFAPLFWLVFVGFGLKAGLFPLHIWLPSAHANAPSHVSAMLSGVAIKVGLYGILRFSGWLPLPPSAGWVVTALGALTALLGIAFALAQTDVKRLLAYSSVENIGIVFIGFGAALLATGQPDAPWGRLALAGALLHVWNHGLFKALLFFGAGSVLHATGTREMSRLGGLWRAMPWTAGLFAIGALAVAGLPPLNGFVSEWLVYLGLFEAVTTHGRAAWVAMPAAVMLGVTGALALATFVKASATIFLGAPRTAAAREAHESGSWMRTPMLFLAAGCVALGLAPMLVWPAIARAVGTWHPGWTNHAAPASLFVLGPVHLGFAAIVSIGCAVLWRVVRARGGQRRPTWDCGYDAPIARMQYTSGSFAAIVAGWFGWILQPERTFRRPRGFFPAGAVRLERTPETVLERAIVPIAGLVLRLSTAVRRLQHGRLQYYIAYVAAALAGLGTVVAWGAQP